MDKFVPDTNVEVEALKESSEHPVAGAPVIKIHVPQHVKVQDNPDEITNK